MGLNASLWKGFFFLLSSTKLKKDKTLQKEAKQTHTNKTEKGHNDMESCGLKCYLKLY